MSPETQAKFITISQVLSIVMGVLLLVAGSFFVDIKIKVNELSREKLDRAEYAKDYQKRNEDIREIKEGQKCLTQAVDSLKDIMIKHTAQLHIKTTWGVGK